MVKITKDEAKYLREHGVTEGITRTMKQRSKRKRIWAAEGALITSLLDEYRKNEKVVYEYGNS